MNRIYFRGGSWWSDALDVRAAVRLMVAPSHSDVHLGFRIVRSYE